MITNACEQLQQQFLQLQQLPGSNFSLGKNYSLSEFLDSKNALEAKAQLYQGYRAQAVALIESWLNNNQKIKGLSFAKDGRIVLSRDLILANKEYFPGLVKEIRGNLHIKPSCSLTDINYLETVEGSIGAAETSLRSFESLHKVTQALNLRGSKIESLPCLEAVGHFILSNADHIAALPRLKEVGVALILDGSAVTALPALKRVNYLSIKNVKFHSLEQAMPNLEWIGVHQGFGVSVEVQDYLLYLDMKELQKQGKLHVEGEIELAADLKSR
jgi:hypothetical protein